MSDTKCVQFLMKCGVYNEGDHAGFDARISEGLIKRDIARPASREYLRAVAARKADGAKRRKEYYDRLAANRAASNVGVPADANEGANG